jgi:hypothetical protein
VFARGEPRRLRQQRVQHGPVRGSARRRRRRRSGCRGSVMGVEEEEAGVEGGTAEERGGA